MTGSGWRHDGHSDRRRSPRGGRRATDVDGRCPTILVAESYASARTAIVEYLRAFRFDVIEATNGDELLEFLSAAPSLIIVEATLPGLVTEAMYRADVDKFIPRSPIIVTRSTPRAAIPHVILTSPAADLAKPFNMSVMLAAVRRALRRPAPLPV